MALENLDKRSKGIILIAALAVLFLLGPYFGIRIFAAPPAALPSYSDIVKEEATDNPRSRSTRSSVQSRDVEPRPSKEEGATLTGIEDLLQ